MVYMVLMALIDLGRMKVYAATRWLWLVLSGGLFVTAPLGCESQDSGKDVVADVPEDPGADMPAPEYGPNWDNGQPELPSADLPQVLYGPVPVDATDDTAGDTPQVLYGPPPA
jgi:hypothetical protein